MTHLRGDFLATITHNERIGSHHYDLGLCLSEAGAEAFADFQPGQFIELDLSRTGLPPAEDIPAPLADAAQRHLLLRRPFSLSSAVRREDGTVRITVVYAVIGPGTLRMTTLRPGDTLQVLGPLGHGFSIARNKTHALLVAGGIGAPPIQHLGAWLSTNRPSVQTVLFAGARSREDLPFRKRPSVDGQPILSDLEDLDIDTLIATDDGSAGHHGFITECLTQWIQSHGNLNPDHLVICACGPDPMLHLCAKIAIESGIDGQISLERHMACGINLCQGCAVPCRIPGTRTIENRMCCQHGPVFDAREVLFETPA